MKYIEWLNIWLNNYVKTSTKMRTYERYSQTVRVNILPALGRYELNELTPLLLQTYVSDLLDCGNEQELCPARA